MTWIAPYAVAKSKPRLTESFDSHTMSDAVTHVGLQFWAPTRDGGVEKVPRYASALGDELIGELRNWGHARGIRVLLCVYNGVGSWDWSLAKAGFVGNREKFVAALMAEMERLKLDGVDIDLEGNGSLDADKEAYVKFMREISKQLHAKKKHLTVDTFAYKWNAPNQFWWPELLPLVDGLTSMGYEETGANAKEWRGYAAQKAAAGKHANKLMIGMPSGKGKWLENDVTEHLNWLVKDGGTGVAFWDSQLNAEPWRAEKTWLLLAKIRGAKK